MGNDVAIRIEGLGKRYQLGQTVDLKRTFRETLVDLPRFFGHKAARALKGAARRTLSAARVQELQSAVRDHRTADPETPPGTFWALRDINLEVKHGEVVGIIGRNGAGKSTLLKILSRVTDPTTGHAEIRGRVASLLEVGTGFNPELTGRENIYLNGSIMGMKKAEIDRKFDEIVAFSEVERFLDTPVKRYSSGMYVRLAFAVAAHLEPDILIIDEVLAVGDAGFQKKCLGKMGDVANAGRTVLFVSHNMGAVSSLCTRAILLADGKIAKTGAVRPVIAHYLQGDTVDTHQESLINHPNRARGFRQMLTRFSMNLGNNTAYYGEPLSFRVGYRFDRRIAVPQIGVRFYNDQGVLAFSLISDCQPNDITDGLEGEGEVECVVKRLPLLPGEYSVSIRLWQPGEKLDDIEGIARFSVEWLNRQIGQFNWDSTTGVVYVDATWRKL